MTVNNRPAGRSRSSFSFTMTDFDLERYEELTDLVANSGMVTLGGAETLAELQEIAEELFADEI